MTRVSSNLWPSCKTGILLQAQESTRACLQPPRAEFASHVPATNISRSNVYPALRYLLFLGPNNRSLKLLHKLISTALSCNNSKAAAKSLGTSCQLTSALAKLLSDSLLYAYLCLLMHRVRKLDLHAASKLDESKEVQTTEKAPTSSAESRA